MKNTITTISSLFIILFCVNTGLAQTEKLKPEVIRPIYFDISPPLRDMPTLSPKTDNTWAVIKNYFNARKNRNKMTFSSDWKDPLRQMNGKKSPATQDSTIENFLGNNNTQGYDPPDTHGDVGPNHYFQVVNCHFSIYSKTGQLLMGPTSNATIWNGMPNNSNGGDGVVMYDEQADRWLFTQLSYPSGFDLEMIAVSQTPDPTGSWYRWEYSFTGLPDYPKFGIWPDGYYMAVNRFTANGSNYLGTGQAAFDRTAMLAGNAGAQMVYFTLPANNNAYGMIPSDCDGPFPPMGTPNYYVYMMDGPDYLGVYEFHVDWTNTANSTLGNFLQLPVAVFNDGLGGVPQKGTSMLAEALADRLMFRLQFRQFSDHWSMVTNHSVNVGANVGGVRWYELRKDAGDWSVYQQSTYSIDNNSRWMGSIAMDTAGNMGLGYSISSSTMYPSIKFTGRLKCDPLNTMSIAEKGIFSGTGNNPSNDGGGTCRWGDYSSMTVDPSDGMTFWYTTEYFTTTSGVGWKTRIASFNFNNVVNVHLSATPDTINVNDAVQLTSSANCGDGNYTFSWTSDPPGFTSTLQNPLVSPSVNTTYIASATSGSNSGTDSIKVVVNLSAVASANPDTITSGTSSQLNVAAFGGDGTYNYVWISNPAGFYSTMSNPVVTPVQPTTYIAYVFTGTQSVSDTTNVYVTYTGINEMGKEPYDVTVMPNPTTGIFTVTFSGLKDPVDISLINSSGQSVFSEKYNFEKSKIYDFTNVSKGIYFLKVGNKVQKLLIH